MVNLKVISKKGSKAAKEIRSETGLGLFKGNKKGLVDGLVNYGLAGDKYNQFMRLWPSAKSLPMVNRNIGYSKYSVCQRAAKKDIPVPESKMTLSKSDKLKDWIEKRTNSIGGIGIKQATNRSGLSGKYYQHFIQNRKYELRVHAFLWTPKKEWRVQKRFGSPDVIAWNYKNGGHFSTVHRPTAYSVFVQAVDISESILNLLGMSFGAVDFLVDNNNKVYFIEINSAPGFTELSKNIYVDAFSRLAQLSKKDFVKFAS
jgi:hypothetical protein